MQNLDLPPCDVCTGGFLHGERYASARNSHGRMERAHLGCSDLSRFLSLHLKRVVAYSECFEVWQGFYALCALAPEERRVDLQLGLNIVRSVNARAARPPDGVASWLEGLRPAQEQVCAQ